MKLGALLAVALLAGPAAAQEVVAGKVYVGDDGVQVAIVPLSGGSGPAQALVRITGVGGELDGKVFVHAVDGDSERGSYTTTLHGRPYSTVTMRRGQYEAYAPGRSGGVRVRFAEDKTR